MKFLFDQNISHRILKLLPEEFNGSTSIKNEGLINAPDKKNWKFAKQNNYIIVTQDSDFNELNSLFGYPPKIIWIRTGNFKTQEIVEIIKNYFTEIKSFVDDKRYGCFEIYNIRNK